MSNYSEADSICGAKCDRRAHTRGLCKSHYARWHRGVRGERLIAPLRLLKDKCEVDGCERKHHAGGYCTLHYQRLERGTPLEAPKHWHPKHRWEGATCVEEACSEKVTSKGRCVNHYAQHRQHQMRLMILCSVGPWCRDCGNDDLSVAAYSFHHTDPDQKRKSVAKWISDENLDEALEEASRCVLLCENCHRTRHHPQKGAVIHHG